MGTGEALYLLERFDKKTTTWLLLLHLYDTLDMILETFFVLFSSTMGHIHVFAMIDTRLKQKYF